MTGTPASRLANTSEVLSQAKAHPGGLGVEDAGQSSADRSAIHGAQAAVRAHQVTGALNSPVAGLLGPFIRSERGD
jgi:hypothetical protein